VLDLILGDYASIDRSSTAFGSYDRFMGISLPLPALLSQALVAFTIEFDNEFEHQVPHRTTNHGSSPGFPRAPWLVSMAMWIRYMRYVPTEGISVAELQPLTGISNKGLNTWLTRLGKWWGYLEIEGQASRGPSKRIAPQAIIRPTIGGQRAIEVWRTLIPLVETRWRERFGSQTVETLEKALRELACQLDPALPAFFSVLEYEDQKSRAARLRLPARELTLPELLAKVLLAVASEFDSQSVAPLALCANVLRVTANQGTRVRDLPHRTFLSADGTTAAIRQLVRGRLAVVQTDASSGRAKILMLTPKARLARDAYLDLIGNIEKDWQKRFGAETMGRLKTSLEQLVVSPNASVCPLLRGLVPYPDGWRASLPPLEGLPHFPMVSHRGGFPDGS
jgi:DNA-binding MarR family transcriptional regulator